MVLVGLVSTWSYRKVIIINLSILVSFYPIYWPATLPQMTMPLLCQGAGILLSYLLTSRWQCLCQGAGILLSYLLTCDTPADASPLSGCWYPSISLTDLRHSRRWQCLCQGAGILLSYLLTVVMLSFYPIYWPATLPIIYELAATDLRWSFDVFRSNFYGNTSLWLGEDHKENYSI